MAKYETVAIADIHVPERLRAVRDDYAGVFALLINRGRELPPVKLRRTPNGKQKLELVAGAHRLRGYELAGCDTIDAQIVKADAKTARAEEIEENLYRYELTALERVTFVAEYLNTTLRPKHAYTIKGRVLNELPEDAIASATPV